jgi:hypothetical protein
MTLRATCGSGPQAALTPTAASIVAVAGAIMTLPSCTPRSAAGASRRIATPASGFAAHEVRNSKGLTIRFARSIALSTMTQGRRLCRPGPVAGGALARVTHVEQRPRLEPPDVALGDDIALTDFVQSGSIEWQIRRQRARLSFERIRNRLFSLTFFVGTTGIEPATPTVSILLGCPQTLGFPMFSWVWRPAKSHPGSKTHPGPTPEWTLFVSLSETRNHSAGRRRGWGCGEPFGGAPHAKVSACGTTSERMTVRVGLGFWLRPSSARGRPRNGPPAFAVT